MGRGPEEESVLGVEDHGEPGGTVVSRGGVLGVDEKRLAKRGTSDRGINNTSRDAPFDYLDSVDME